MRKLLTALLFPALAGCINLAKDYPERHLHVVSAERPGDAAPGAKGLVLAVKPFGVASRYEGSEFVYRKTETEWETDYYNGFFVPPKSILTDATRNWLGRSGIFQHVTSLSSAVPPTHILEGHVAQLWIDARTSPPKAVLEIQFLLADDRESPARILFSKSYAETTPMKS
ncbi:MAG: hypothetical protein K8T20_02130, partial [Planctomycetes bacterium]|nr:hypothetical protein [Planctomycetota bacterium]